MHAHKCTYQQQTALDLFLTHCLFFLLMRTYCFTKYSANLCFVVAAGSFQSTTPLPVCGGISHDSDRESSEVQDEGKDRGTVGALAQPPKLKAI